MHLLWLSLSFPMVSLSLRLFWKLAAIIELSQTLTGLTHRFTRTFTLFSVTGGPGLLSVGAENGANCTGDADCQPGELCDKFW